jgi:hypothetical protein
MLLLNLTLQGYVLVMIITAFLILLDSIGALINSRLYREYYRLETLPWNKFLYKKIKPIGAFLLSLCINSLTLAIFILLDIRISWVLVLFGFWIYRFWHTCLRLWYWRKDLFGGRKNG